MMAPQFEAAARSLEPHVRLGKLDIEAEQQICEQRYRPMETSHFPERM